MKRFKPKVLLVCVLTLLLGMANLAVGAPANNNCANATSVGNVTNLTFDTTSATFDGPGDCERGPNIWYVYTATQSGGVIVSLCGSSYDTALAVYDGSDCPPEDMIRCNDDFCGKQSELAFYASAGREYLIEVGGWEGYTGQGVLNISYGMVPDGRPSNDDCDDAMSVGNVTNLTFDTNYATFDGPGHCMESPNIWYTYYAPYTGNVTVSLCGSSYDSKLAIYRNGYGWYPEEDDLIDCNDDFCGMDAQITFTAVAGSHYLIEVGAYNSEAGQGVLNISSGWGPGPGEPPNDDCYNATHVGNVTNLPFSTHNASFDGPGHYNYTDNVWYRYTAPYTCDVTVSLCGSSYDTVLVVYDGWDCYPAYADMITGNDDFCGLQSEVTLPVIAGHHYLIEVGGATDSDHGPGVLTINCEGWQPSPPPWGSNDNCYNAKPIGNVTDLPFNTTNATFDGPEGCVESPNIWYRYTATGTGDVTVSLCGSSYDTKLAVYRGVNCPPNPSDLIECNDDFCGYQSQITFAAIAGRQYLFDVGGFGSSTGQGVISVSFEGGKPPTKALDLGDAPDSTNNSGRSMTAYPKGEPLGVRASYPTVFNDGSGKGPYGPVHLNPLAVAHLGSTITNESEADIGIDQDGINNINSQANWPDNDQGDDGVMFPFNLPHCRWTTFDYFVNVINPSTNLWVNVWCDWNRDGDWDDEIATDDIIIMIYPPPPKRSVPEWAVQNQYLFNLPAGLNQLTTPAFLSWHPKNTPEEIWMRITLSERPWTGGSNPGSKGNGGSGPQTGYEYGETEDYYFTPKTSYTACEDFNGDGVINLADLATFTTDWLENCP